MVRFNEALLVGISLLAALVLSKGRESVSSLSNLPFIDPFTNLLSKAQAQAIEKQEKEVVDLQDKASIYYSTFFTEIKLNAARLK